MSKCIIKSCFCSYNRSFYCFSGSSRYQRPLDQFKYEHDNNTRKVFTYLPLVLAGKKGTVVKKSVRASAPVSFWRESMVAVVIVFMSFSSRSGVKILGSSPSSLVLISQRALALKIYFVLAFRLKLAVKFRTQSIQILRCTIHT